MIRRLALLGLICVMVASPAPARAPARAPVSTPADLRGVWRNPDRSVLVRIDQCGGEICGVVVGANAEAIADARDGGYPQLIGMTLLYGYHATSPVHWVGRVLVPDLGHIFSSHIDLIDPRHARIAGCLFRQHLCQTQVWERA